MGGEDDQFPVGGSEYRLYGMRIQSVYPVREGSVLSPILYIIYSPEAKQVAFAVPSNV